MAGPATRRLQGQDVGWTGHARNIVAVTASDVTVYDPPLRYLFISGAGNVVLVLDGDDEANSANYFTKAVLAGEKITELAIRQVRATNTTATGFTGAR